MTKRRNLTVRAAVAAFAAIVAVRATGHSASDAYLTLDVQGSAATGASGDTVVHGQWDVALRDLHFVLRLDDDGDGNITWSELRKHQPEIARYVYPNLRVSGDDRPCTIKPTRQAVADHADGSYAVLYFDIVCGGAPRRLTIDYRLFFAVDPSHRGIAVLRSGTNAATALFAPDNATIEFRP